MGLPLCGGFYRAADYERLLTNLGNLKPCGENTFEATVFEINLVKDLTRYMVTGYGECHYGLMHDGVLRGITFEAIDDNGRVTGRVRVGMI